MKWIKNHLSLCGIAVLICGLALLAYAIHSPVERITEVGEITVIQTYFSTWIFLTISMTFIVSGALITIKNEARAYYNRKEFFDNLGINKIRKR